MCRVKHQRFNVTFSAVSCAITETPISMIVFISEKFLIAFEDRIKVVLKTFVIKERECMFGTINETNKLHVNRCI